MLSSPRTNGLDSLLKEVKVFKEVLRDFQRFLEMRFLLRNGAEKC